MKIHCFIEVQKNKNGEPVKACRKKISYVEIVMSNELSENETVRLRIEKVVRGDEGEVLEDK